MLAAKPRLQAALDFMVAYSAAFLVIAIALYVVVQLGVFNSRLAPLYCDTDPTFACASVGINTSGGLTVVLAQYTGGTISIAGAACSSQVNGTSNRPLYGNVNVQDYAHAAGFYPNAQFQSPVTLYSGNATALRVYCYASSGGPATGRISDGFTGYLWLNYTITNLPQKKIIGRAVSISTKYS